MINDLCAFLYDVGTHFCFCLFSQRVLFWGIKLIDKKVGIDEVKLHLYQLLVQRQLSLRKHPCFLKRYNIDNVKIIICGKYYKIYSDCGTILLYDT